MRRYKFISDKVIPRADSYPLKNGEHVVYSALYRQEVNRFGSHHGQIGVVRHVYGDDVVDIVWPQGPRSSSLLKQKYLDRVIP
jgi:hypothetical protein